MIAEVIDKGSVTIRLSHAAFQQFIVFAGNVIPVTVISTSMFLNHKVV